MTIQNIEEFSCHLCGYITRDKYKIAMVKKTGKCPACFNGEHKGWYSTNKNHIHQC